jgi:hypothetical protein
VRVLRDPGLHSVLRQFSATVARATVLVVQVFPELVGHHEFTKFAAVSHLRPQKNRPFREGGRNVSWNRLRTVSEATGRSRMTLKCEKPGARNRLWLVPGYGGMFLCKKSKEAHLSDVDR